MSEEALSDVLILGNPNSGKSLLFNRLTGLRQKVANFPGVTVEIRQGASDGSRYHDYPGVYSLNPLTVDEQVAIRGFQGALRKASTRGILCVLDATRLERSLYLLLQILPVARAAGCPVLVVVNVLDEVVSRGSKVDLAGLSEALRAPVLGASARKGNGLDEIKAWTAALPARATAEFTEPAPAPVIELKERAREIAKAHGPKGDILLKSQNRLDDFFLNGFLGPIVFALLMLILFQSIFTWASPLMDLFEGVVASAGEVASGWFGEGMLADFVRDALFAGVGSFVVFAPQIFVLFLLIGILEDSGYLARAAVILHRPLSWFGLSGRSFLPLLSGHACAIPAIMAARSIESPRKRLLTILAVPFTSCSARLPVYALFVGGFVPATTILGGLIGLQGFAFFCLFALGLLTALLASAFMDRVLRGGAKMQDAPFVVELPPYRLPSPKPILYHAWTRAWSFLKGAGGVIFAVVVVVWFLGYFPNGNGHLDTSYLGRIGHWIEPIFAPMGMDWKIGVGVLTSFLAREVFVGTLGTLYGIEAADENLATLSERLSAGGMTLATAVSLLVFYALAMQCVSTLATIRRETGSNKIPVLVFVGMTAVAYVAAFVAYRIFV